MLALESPLVKLNKLFEIFNFSFFFVAFIYLFLSIFTSFQAFRINEFYSELNPDINGIQFEEINFKNKFSTSLNGWWVEGESDNAFIILHGLRSNIGDKFYIDLIGEFNDLGFSILAFDFRNHGKSGEGKFSFGVEEVYDVEASIKYIRENKNIENIFIWGFSFGATTGLNYSIYNPKGADVSGIIADTPYYDPIEVLIDEVSKRTPLNSYLSKLLKPGIIISSKVFFDNDLENIKNIFESETINNTPSLIFGCKNDTTVPNSHPRRIKKKLGQMSKYVEFENCSKHGDSFIYNNEEYIYEINNFLNEQFEIKNK